MTIRQYIQKYILLKIVSGEWQPDSILPSENQLAKKFSCSRIIARQALTTFVSAGILQPQKGRGYVVLASGIQDFLESNSKRFNSIKEKVEWLNEEESKKHYNFIQEEYIQKSNFLEDFKLEEMGVKVKEYYDEKGLVCVQITYLKNELINTIGKEKVSDSLTKAMVNHAIIPTARRKEYFPNKDYILDRYKEELGWDTIAIASICQLFVEEKLIEVSAKLVRKDVFRIRTKKEIIL
ncbi:GntR family transcriptional regulator [Mycoplasma todarodis]|uniref:HTH gntR-type domain-containing protein n=1 Tax=Mycoplasma todarodis TaxID=1937191 RepID=A0A4R0XS98_9MOLU|nr:GntR family transcriptional regulator [Mycoplasma todarodis]TCG10567.1 hypothetical protein C4B25_03670 [Mycoplasma todarodis]